MKISVNWSILLCCSQHQSFPCVPWVVIREIVELFPDVVAEHIHLNEYQLKFRDRSNYTMLEL
eukprot:5575690-Amphidinium_carterae.1